MAKTTVVFDNLNFFYDWRDSASDLAVAAAAYVRERKAFDDRTREIVCGSVFPTIHDLVDGQPPFRDRLSEDIGTFVARSRSTLQVPESLRADLHDFGVWPTCDGAIRIFDETNRMCIDDVALIELSPIRDRAAWYAAIFGSYRMRSWLSESFRGFDPRRMAYLLGLSDSRVSPSTAADWKRGTQLDLSTDGQRLMRCIGQIVECLDWMSENDAAVRDFMSGKLNQPQLFALTGSSDSAAPTNRQTLQNDPAARLARAEQLAAEGATGVDESGNVVDDDVRLAAEALAIKTMADLLGTPRIRVLGPVPEGGSGDQRTFAKSFSTLANMGTPLVVANGVAGIAADLAGMWPHAVDTVNRILSDVREGEPIRMRPILLVGAPGSGKTSLLGAICRRLGLPSIVFPCASVSDGSFGGTPAQWHSRRVSTPLQLIKTSGKANPAVILDEIEKTGVSAANGSLVHALLPMLERHNAGSYFETALEQNADLSAVVFLATANDLSKLSDPLRDRFRVLRMPDATLEHLPALAAGIVLDLAGERGVPAGLLPELVPDELEVVARAWGGGSLRKLKAAIAATIDLRDAMAVRQ